MAKRGAEDEIVRTLAEASPRDFTRVRAEAAKRLAQQGDSAAAKRVRALRRPSLSVWAVAMLARAAPELLEALLHAGAALQKAQRQALSGSGAETLRTSHRALLQALGAATDRAEELLLASGAAATRATLDRIRATLQAAATAPEDERRALRAGTLGRDLTREGFGPIVDVKATPARKPNPRDAQKAEAARARAEGHLAQVTKAWERADAKLQQAERALARARALEEAARRKLEAARAEVKQHGGA